MLELPIKTAHPSTSVQKSSLSPSDRHKEGRHDSAYNELLVWAPSSCNLQLQQKRLQNWKSCPLLQHDECCKIAQTCVTNKHALTIDLSQATFLYWSVSKIEYPSATTVNNCICLDSIANSFVLDNLVLYYDLPCMEYVCSFANNVDPKFHTSFQM